MKKLYLSLLVFSVLILSLVTVSADTCTPSSGYNSCSEWSNSESYGSCNARSHVKIMTNTIPGIQISGNYKGGYFVGPSWIPYSIDADNAYLYLNKNSWDGLWNTADCGANDGKTCRNYDYQLGSTGKFYLTNNPGDSFSGCPIFVGTDYDRVDNSDCWSWVSTYGGWGWLGDSCLNAKQVECFDNSDCGSNQFCEKTGDWTTWSCEEKICDEGQERCFGTNLERCEGNGWVDKGITLNKCGVECTTDQQCNPSGEILGSNETYCGGNDILEDFETRECIFNKCVDDSGTNVIDSCNFRCEDVEGEGAMCITKVCDAGEKMCSDEENVLACSGVENKWVLDEECGYGCEDKECISYYSTSQFYWIVGGVFAVVILFIIFLVVRLTKKGKKRKRK